MAISKGHLKFTGRIGELVYYYVGNEIYVRTVFAGQRKRVMKDKRYELFRLYGTFFSQSSKIGSFVYKALGLKKNQKMYNRLVGEAQKFFRHTGMSGQEVLEVMVEKWVNGLEVEVPATNEDGGRIYQLWAKRKKAEKERAGKAGKVKVSRNHSAEEAGVNEEKVEVKTVAREEVVTGEVMGAKEQRTQVVEKRLRITRAEVKIRWKERNGLSIKKGNGLRAHVSDLLEEAIE
ncbi:MAG: hypothetical protein ABW007_21305 [Chitinophagaceae bacterium]